MAHILIIDDDVMTLITARRALAANYMVTAVASLKHLPRTFMPDLALIDLQLPQTTGFIIRDVLTPVRCVAISGYVGGDTISHVQQAGFVGFLGKPFVPRTLPAYVAALLEGVQIWQPRSSDPYLPSTEKKEK